MIGVSQKSYMTTTLHTSYLEQYYNQLNNVQTMPLGRLTSPADMVGRYESMSPILDNVVIRRNAPILISNQIASV